MQLGFLVCSDSVATEHRQDRILPAVQPLLLNHGSVACSGIVPDDVETIFTTLQAWLPSCDVVFTSGGTGLSPRDVTPEATLRLKGRLVPGISEDIRRRSANPASGLSRGVAIQKDKTLIVNLPGSPDGVIETLEWLLDLLPHAVAVMNGAHHG